MIDNLMEERTIKVIGQERMNRPNIFLYATSELSQDAFICWLCDWANPECKAIDKKLHTIGVRFIYLMLSKHQIVVHKIEKIEIQRQYKRIDVLIKINDSFFIIIEDKKFTEIHSDQLNRYKSSIKKEFTGEVFGIYYKMVEESNYEKVSQAGFRPIQRNELLLILKKYNGDNDILISYRSIIDKIEREVQSYQIFDVSEWNSNSWRGFFVHLSSFFSGSNWGYINNREGGFWGFWYILRKTTLGDIYLQLEEKKLCIKFSPSLEIKENKKTLAKRRDDIFNVINQKVEKFNFERNRPINPILQRHPDIGTMPQNHQGASYVTHRKMVRPHQPTGPIRSFPSSVLPSARSASDIVLAVEAPSP